MEVKICSKCKMELPIDMFRWKNKAQGKKHSQCKACQSKQEHQHYLENQERRETIRLRTDVQKRNNIEFIENKKLQGCAKCKDKRFYVLDFHHVNPEQKDGTIAHMIKSSSIEKLVEEVDKCILLCANCHREFHYLEKEKGIKLEDFLNGDK